MASSASPSAAFSLFSFINHLLNHSFIPTLIYSLLHSLAAFRVAGALHRASWRSCGGRGHRWAAAGFAWQAQYRELLPFAWRSIQSLVEELRCAWAPLCRGWLRVVGIVQRISWLPFVWQAQYTEPCGGVAARVGAAGPRLASCGRRSTESFLGALRVAGRVDLSSPFTSQFHLSPHNFSS